MLVILCHSMNMTSTNNVSAAERILFEIKSRGARNIGELGESLGMSPEGARQHLVKLHEAGLVEHVDEKRPRGRPIRRWHLTEAGHGRFPDSHAQLTVDLFSAARAAFGEDGVERLIAERERQMLSDYATALEGADSLQVRVERLAELRRREGYMAESSKGDAGDWILVENHCPVCAAARVCQGLCRSELEIFRSVLGPEAKVERTDHIIAGARRCAYRISPN